MGGGEINGQKKCVEEKGPIFYEAVYKNDSGVGYFKGWWGWVEKTACEALRVRLEVFHNGGSGGSSMNKKGQFQALYGAPEVGEGLLLRKLRDAATLGF